MNPAEWMEIASLVMPFTFFRTAPRVEYKNCHFFRERMKCPKKKNTGERTLL